MAAYLKGSTMIGPHPHWSRLRARIAPVAGFLLLGAGVIVLPVAAIALLFASSPANSADAPGLLSGGLWGGALGLLALLAGGSLLRGRRPGDTP